MHVNDLEENFDEHFNDIFLKDSGSYADIAEATVANPPFPGMNRGDKVALKSPKDGEGSALERMERESKTLEALMKHNVPEIITYYGCLHTQDDNIPVIAEELAECNLKYLRKSKYKGKNFPEILMDSIMERIAAALIAVHKIGYFHRDIKPSNIYIVHGNLAKLGDFGSAGPNRYGDEWHPEYGKSETSGGAHGTPNFVAPEALIHDDARKFHYSVSTDIYSLGCIGYYLITAKTLFAEKKLEHNLPELQKVKEDTDYINKMIAELTAGKKIALHKIKAIRKAISPDPKDRQKSVREFLDEYKHGPEEAVLIEIERKIKAALAEPVDTSHGATQIGTVDAFLGAYEDMLAHVQKTGVVSPTPEQARILLKQRSDEDYEKLFEYINNKGSDEIPPRSKPAERKQFIRELWTLFHCWGNTITKKWIIDENMPRMPIGQIDEEAFNRYYEESFK